MHKLLKVMCQVRLLLSLLLGLALFPLFYLEIQAGTVDVPDRPTNLLAHASSPTRVDLFWNTPANDGGSPIIGYKIEYQRLSSLGYLPLDANTNNSTTSYTHTGLTTGETYFYRVYAINDEGLSTFSIEDSAKPESNSEPLEDIVPNTPTSLTAVDMSPTSIDKQWTACYRIQN